MKVLIFGGTTEGRDAATQCMADGNDILVCVTSEYARALLPEGMRCHVGMLDADAMLALMQTEQPELVIDATHPFAVRVTENILNCTEDLNIPYRRILRENSAGEWRQHVEWVQDTDAAIRALEKTVGNILLTTGSNTLAAYMEGISAERLYARVLPTISSIEKCKGLPPGHIIAMQGPFSQALNGAMYDQLNIAVMVSKDSGETGGVTDKVVPALQRGMHVIMIKRPKEN